MIILQQLNAIIAASMSIKSSSKLKKILEVKRIHSHLHKMTSAVKADLCLFLDDSCVWELHEQWEERISIWISTPKSGPGETKHLYKNEILAYKADLQF